MTIHTILDVSALAAAALLFLVAQGRAVAAVALVAAGLEVAADLGLFRVSVARVDVGLVLAVVLLVAGLVAWFRASTKPAISAATVVAFVGLVQVLGLARGRGVAGLVHLS